MASTLMSMEMASSSLSTLKAFTMVLVFLFA
jgi:hypothetical protein